MPTGDYPSVDITAPEMPMTVADFSNLFTASLNGSSVALELLGELTEAQFDDLVIARRAILDAPPPEPAKVKRGASRILAAVTENERIAKIIENDTR